MKKSVWLLGVLVNIGALLATGFVAPTAYADSNSTLPGVLTVVNGTKSELIFKNYSGDTIKGYPSNAHALGGKSVVFPADLSKFYGNLTFGLMDIRDKRDKTLKISIRYENNDNRGSGCAIYDDQGYQQGSYRCSVNLDSGIISVNDSFGFLELDSGTMSPKTSTRTILSVSGNANAEDVKYSVSDMDSVSATVVTHFDKSQAKQVCIVQEKEDAKGRFKCKEIPGDIPRFILSSTINYRAELWYNDPRQDARLGPYLYQDGPIETDGSVASEGTKVDAWKNGRPRYQALPGTTFFKVTYKATDPKSYPNYAVLTWERGVFNCTVHTPAQALPCVVNNGLADHGLYWYSP